MKINRDQVNIISSIAFVMGGIIIAVVLLYTWDGGFDIEYLLENIFTFAVGIALIGIGLFIKKGKYSDDDKGNNESDLK